MLKGALAVIIALFDFAKGVSSGHADRVLVGVRWLTHADPTLWLEGAKRQMAVKS